MCLRGVGGTLFQLTTDVAPVPKVDHCCYNGPTKSRDTWRDSRNPKHTAVTRYHICIHCCTTTAHTEPASMMPMRVGVIHNFLRCCNVVNTPRHSQLAWIAARYWPYLLPKMFLFPPAPVAHPRQPVFTSSTTVPADRYCFGTCAHRKTRKYPRENEVKEARGHVVGLDRRMVTSTRGWEFPGYQEHFRQICGDRDGRSRGGGEI